MAHVFISYAHEDGEFVLKDLRRELREAGIEVWIDEDRLEAGEDWRESIDDAIRSAFVVIVVMTPAADHSKYVTYEWACAWGAGIPVVPILLKAASLHPRLESLQYLNFKNWQNRPWDKLIKQLKALEAMPKSARPPAPLVLPESTPADKNVVLAHLTNATQNHDQNAIQLILDMGEAAWEPLLSALSDSQPELAQAAAYIFDRMGGDSVFFLWEAAQANHPLRRVGAIRGLSLIGHATSVVPKLLEALRDEDVRVRDAAIQGLRQIGRAAVPELCTALGDSEAEKRHDAALLLGQMKDKRAIPYLLKSLRDVSESVRIASADALGEIGGETVVEALTQVLLEPLDSVVFAAVLALIKINDRRVIPDILNIARNKARGIDLRVLATAVLGQFKAEEAEMMIEDILMDTDEVKEVRKVAVSAAGQIGSGVFVPAIMTLLEHENDDEVVPAALIALGQIGDPNVLPVVREHLNHPNPGRRIAAVRAIGILHDTESVPALQALMSDRHRAVSGERVCDVAEHVLVEMGAS